METLYYLVREKTTSEPVAIGMICEYSYDTQGKFHTNILILDTQWCENISLPEYETYKVFDMIPEHNRWEPLKPPISTGRIPPPCQRWCLTCNCHRWM